MISVKSAPRWLSIVNALTTMAFYSPILVLFFEYKGVGLGSFFLIQGIARLFIFITEIPTGYIGDIFSRKHTIISAFLMWIFGYLLWIFGYGFWFIICGEFFFSIAMALMSGTIEAYLYDLLKKRHKEEKYHLKLAKMETAENFTVLLSTLPGAFLYQFFGPTAPIWATMFCLLIGLIILVFLPDVPESKRLVAKDKSKWQDILDISKYAIKNKEIKWLMIFHAVYGTLTLAFWWGLQPIMIHQEIPVFVFGLVISMAAFMMTLWASISGKILEKFKLSGVIKILSVTIIVATGGACFAVYVPVWCTFICLFLTAIGSGSAAASKIVTSVLINHRIKSDERATVLSVRSMFSKIFTGLGLICLKPLFDNIGVGPTFMVSALLLIPILICARHLYKMNLKTMKEA